MSSEDNNGISIKKTLNRITLNIQKIAGVKEEAGMELLTKKWKNQNKKEIDVWRRRM